MLRFSTNSGENVFLLSYIMCQNVSGMCRSIDVGKSAFGNKKKTVNKMELGGRLRPGSATWRTGRNVRAIFDSGLFPSLYENMTPCKYCWAHQWRISALQRECHLEIMEMWTDMVHYIARVQEVVMPIEWYCMSCERENYEVTCAERLATESQLYRTRLTKWKFIRKARMWYISKR